MKIKKLVTGIIAGAVAATALASLTLTSSAAEATKTLWEGSLWMNDKAADQARNKGLNNVTLTVTDGGSGDSEGLKGMQSPAYWKSGSKLVISYEPQATYKSTAAKGTSLDVAFAVIGKVTDAWSWTQGNIYILEKDGGYAAMSSANSEDEEAIAVPGVTVNSDNTEITIDLDENGDAYAEGDAGKFNWYNLITQMKEFDLRAADCTIKSVKITGDYDAPVFDEYIDNGDGSYTYVYSGSVNTSGPNENTTFTLSVPEGTDAAKVKKIKFDITASDWSTFKLGVSSAAEGNEWLETGDLKITSDELNKTQTYTLETPNGIVADSAKITCSWLNANTTYTISNIRFLKDDDLDDNETLIGSADISDFGWNDSNVIPFNLTGYDSAKIVVYGDCTYIKLAVGGIEPYTVLVEPAATNEDGKYVYNFTEEQIATFSQDCDLYVQGQDGTVTKVQIIGAKNPEDSSEEDSNNETDNNTYSFSVQASPSEGGAVDYTAGTVELAPDDGTRSIDVSNMTTPWTTEQSGRLAKKILKGGDQDGAVWTDNSGNELLASTRSITITVSGSNGTKLHTTGSIVYNFGSWTQFDWKANVGDDDQADDITIEQVGNDFNITYTSKDAFVTVEDLAADNSFFSIAVQNFGDSTKNTTPDMVLKGIELKDADGNVIWSDGEIAQEVKYSAGTGFTCKATAAEGYTFTNWTDDEGNEVSTEAEFTYTLTAKDTVLTANFVEGGSSDESSTTSDESTSDADSSTDSSTSSTSSGNGSGSNGSTTGGSGSTGGSSGSASGSDASTNTGASALTFVGLALAGAAVVVTKKKK